MSEHPGKTQLADLQDYLGKRVDFKGAGFPLYPPQFRSIASYVSDLEARLEKAREVIKPFADQAGTFDSDGAEFVPDQFEPAIVGHTIGQLRAARAWMEQNDE